MASNKILERQLKDWKTKYRNLQVSNEISEIQFKGEIQSLKKELAEKDKKIEALFEIIRKLDEKVEALTAEVTALRKENAELREIIADKDDQIMKLKARLGKDSDNSNKPSSTDGFKKVVQNNREKTGRKPGGQVGHN